MVVLVRSESVLLALCAAATAVLSCEATPRSSEPTPTGSGAASTSSDAAHPLCANCSLEAQPAASRADEVCCTATRTSVDPADPRAVALGVDRYVKWIEGGYDGPFRWRRSWGSTRAKGFDRQTRLQLTASVQGIEYVDQERSMDPSNPLLCPSVACDDYLDFDISVQVATEDGAINATADLHAATQTYTDSIVSTENPDLGAFTGKLDLGVAQVQSQKGGVATELQFSESGVQGILVPWISSQPMSEGGDAYSAPLVGEWPVPTCAGKGLPIGLDIALDSASGRTMRQLFADVSLQFDGMSVPASWGDGTRTEMTVGEPDGIEQACSDGATTGHVMTSLHFQTADGKVDEVLPAQFSLAWDTGGDTLVWGWLAQSEVLDKSSLRAIVGSLADGSSDQEAMIQAGGISSGPASWSIVGATGTPLAKASVQWCQGDCATSASTEASPQEPSP
jgi:hypothetical protein